MPPARFPDPLFGPAVEVLVTDKASYREAETQLAGGGSPPRRAARAGARRRGRMHARRRRAPVRGRARARRRYEDALRAEGLPTYRATGRGYFGQQQVVDLLAYLRLLQNRYDDEAFGDRARLAARRRVPDDASSSCGARRVAAPCSPASSASLRPACRARDRRLFDGVPPALRPARAASGAARARAPLRAHRRRARLRPRRARAAGTAGGATPTSASSPGSRARSRSCAGPTSRVRPLRRASRRQRARARWRRSRRRRAPRPSGC